MKKLFLTFLMAGLFAGCASKSNVVYSPIAVNAPEPTNRPLLQAALDKKVPPAKMPVATKAPAKIAGHTQIYKVDRDSLVILVTMAAIVGVSFLVFYWSTIKTWVAKLFSKKSTTATTTTTTTTTATVKLSLHPPTPAPAVIAVLPTPATVPSPK